jgi:hypothetical protein
MSLSCKCKKFPLHTPNYHYSIQYSVLLGWKVEHVHLRMEKKLIMYESLRTGTCIHKQNSPSKLTLIIIV